MPIPINAAHFKRDFLGGGGSLNFQAGSPSGPALLLDEPIPDDVSTLFAASAAAAPARLEFGNPAGLQAQVSFEAGAANGIEVIRPGEAPDFLEDRFTEEELERLFADSQIGVRLFFSARADGNLSGKLPAGPAAFDFGVRAGASAGYERFLLAGAADTAGTVIRRALADVRLPQDSGTPDRMPAPGEILSFRYNGFLDLEARLQWGYQLNGIESFEFEDLAGALEYHVRLKAAASAAYRLAGEFEIETRRGEPGRFVHLIIRKRRDRAFSFAAGFEAALDSTLDGLPESADEFLTAFLGADAQTALNIFDEIRKLSDLDELERRTGKLLMPSLRNLAQKWLGRALDHQSVSDFIRVLDRVVTTYRNADEILAGKVMDFYEDHFDGRLSELRGALVRIRDFSSREALRNLAGDDRTWDLMERLAGGDVFRLLESNELFAEVQEAARQGVDFLDGKWQPELKDLVDELKASLKADEILGRLAKFSSKEKLRALADERLQGAVERILGNSFEAIRDEAGPAAARLREALDAVEGFKSKFQDFVQKAYRQSFSLAANYAYSRASTRNALLDMEFDVSKPEGRALFEAAAHGRLREALTRANLRFVRVHEAQLTHTVTKSSILQIHVYGWSARSLTEVVSQTANSLEVQDGGLVQVFATEASIKKRREKGGEILESNFLLRMLGENLRSDDAPAPDGLRKKGFLVKTLRSLSVQYQYLVSDEMADARELTEYLALAEVLGLVPSAAETAARINTEFPQGLGRVEARYVVRYQPDAVRAIFQNFSDTHEEKTLTRLVRAVCRQVVAARFIYMKRTDWDARVGFAYLDPRNAALFNVKGSFNAFQAAVGPATLPAWFTGKKARKVNLPEKQLNTLYQLYRIETSFARQVVRLDRLIDDVASAPGRAVSDRDLEKAARKLVEQGGRVAEYGPQNALFAVFDYLAFHARGAKALRESSMILEITPSGGRTVRKFFLSGPPEDAVLASAGAAQPAAAAAGGSQSS